MPDSPDQLRRFILEGAGVRGEVVRLDATWRGILERRAYPDRIRTVLGEASAAVALLAATIKFSGTLILQARGGAGIHLLVVEATGQRTLRGLARWHDGAASLDGLEAMLAGAKLAITVDPGEGRDRYQGIVEVNASSVGGVLEDYFARSEQLPTRLWLAAGEDHVAGLLLQHLPDEGGADDPDARAENWGRAVTLADTVTPGELLELDAHVLLRRLFHQESVRVFEPQGWSFACTCSRERVKNTLRMLGQEEMEDLLEREGTVDAHCEFCGMGYSFDALEVTELFVEPTHDAPGWEM